MTDYGVKCEDTLDLPDIDLHGMVVCVVTWHNGTKFARFHREGRHHDAPLGVITGPLGQAAIHAIRNTFEYYLENA